MPDCHTGVFAFEGDWYEDLRDKDSVRPTLETLRDVRLVDFIHRRIGTTEELKYYVDKWLGGESAENYDDYLIGYFAFHGEQGLVSPGGGDVSLDQISSWIKGRAQGRTLYFGSCSMLDLETKEIKSFLRSTKARAVVGFTKDVGWLESAAYDLILLDALAYRHRRPHTADNYLQSPKRPHFKAFAKELGLKIITPSSKS
jgi:hypothetical protein|tara:strand:+ start:186 stop:785 length:600 start_codon:yes stop_codon:yes gene_type:complete